MPALRRLGAVARPINSASAAAAHHLPRSLHTRPTPTLLARPSKILSADDPFGEKASMSEHDFMMDHLKHIDADRVEASTFTQAANDKVFNPSDLGAAMEKVRRAMVSGEGKKGEEGNLSADDLIEAQFPTIASLGPDAAALSSEERLVLLAQHLTDEDRRIAEVLPSGGIARWLAMSPADRKQMRMEYRHTELQNARKEHWHNKSYSSYEEYVRREVIGVTADDVDATAPADLTATGHVADVTFSTTATTLDGGASAAADAFDGFEDDGEDGISGANGNNTDDTAMPLPNMTPKAASGSASDEPASPAPADGDGAYADSLIGDADAYRREMHSSSAAADDAQTEGADDEKPVVMFEPGKHYQLPNTDPSRWTTEDVIAWLDCFAEDGVMDDEMIKTFRMVSVDGDMLLNKVMPPNLFKVMRKWHLHRSNPKTRHLAEQLVVETEMVQYTIYLCFPYCGQMS